MIFKIEPKKLIHPKIILLILKKGKIIKTISNRSIYEEESLKEGKLEKVSFICFLEIEEIIIKEDFIKVFGRIKKGEFINKTHSLVLEKEFSIDLEEEEIIFIKKHLIENFINYIFTYSYKSISLLQIEKNNSLKLLKEYEILSFNKKYNFSFEEESKKINKEITSFIELILFLNNLEENKNKFYNIFILGRRNIPLRELILKKLKEFKLIIKKEFDFFYEDYFPEYILEEILDSNKLFSSSLFNILKTDQKFKLITIEEFKNYKPNLIKFIFLTEKIFSFDLFELLKNNLKKLIIINSKEPFSSYLENKILIEFYY